MTVAVIGYASLDFSTSVRDFRGVDATSILQRGIMSAEPDAGGIAHIVRAAARAGAPTTAVSWVGDDRFGALWAEAIATAGSSDAGVSVLGDRSPNSTLIHIGTGGTICLFDPGACTPERLSEAQRAVLRDSAWVVLTVAPRAVVAEVLDLLPDDTGLIWAVKHDDAAYTPESIERILARADVVSFSAAERAYVSAPGLSPEQRVRPGALVVETRGPAGVAWSFGSALGPDRADSMPVEPIEAENTTGAGDTFVGALAAGFAAGGGRAARSDADVRALVATASAAAGALLRSRIPDGPLAVASLKEPSDV